MKLYLYAGEALDLILPYNHSQAGNIELVLDNGMLYANDKTIAYYPQNLDILHPKNQVSYIHTSLLHFKNTKNVVICTHSPTAFEAAIKAGKRHGYEIKCFHVIFDETDKSKIKLETNSPFEACFKDFNRAIKLLDKLDPEEIKDN